MTKSTCRRLKSDDVPCKNRAMRGSDFCFQHTFSRKKDVFFYIGLISFFITVLGVPTGGYQLYLAMYPPPPPVPAGAEKKQADRLNRKELWQNVREGKSAPARSGPIGPSATGGATCQAWLTPVFNPYPVSYSDLSSVFCHDLPIIDVVRDTNNPAWPQSEAEYESIRQFSVGDQIAIGIYIDNGGIDTEAYTAKNVQITTSVKQANGLNIISTTFTADNAAPRTGSIYIDADPRGKVEPILQSGYMYDYHGRVVLDQQNLELVNDVNKLGDLDAGFMFSLFFTYKFRVVQA